ncbi:MAG: hypothetical protein PHI27_01195 [Eubacteriales bacterium]|nr:hypothetical protein [Eubacteriales bacterium]MDD3880850.1 hypothetical protein [Eubacteriales bacterium]MDD4511783.1 hypothetical protein [Eubacteriales bacterium]
MKITILGGQDTANILFALQDVISVYGKECELALYEKSQGMAAIYARSGQEYSRRQGVSVRVYETNDLSLALTGAQLVLLTDVSGERDRFAADSALMREQGMTNQIRVLSGVGGAALFLRLAASALDYGREIGRICPNAKVIAVMPQADKIARLLSEVFSLDAYGYDLYQVIGSCGIGAVAELIKKEPRQLKLTTYGVYGMTFIASAQYLADGNFRNNQGMEMLPLIKKRVGEGAMGEFARYILDTYGAVFIGDEAVASQYLASRPDMPLEAPADFAFSQDDLLKMGQLLAGYVATRDMPFDRLLAYGLPQHSALFGLSLIKEMPPMRAPSVCARNEGSVKALSDNMFIELPLLSLGGAALRPSAIDAPDSLFALLDMLARQQENFILAAKGDRGALRDFCESDSSLEGLDRLYCLDALYSLIGDNGGEDLCF